MCTKKMRQALLLRVWDRPEWLKPKGASGFGFTLVGGWGWDLCGLNFLLCQRILYGLI